MCVWGEGRNLWLDKLGVVNIPESCATLIDLDLYSSSLVVSFCLKLILQISSF